MRAHIDDVDVQTAGANAKAIIAKGVSEIPPAPVSAGTRKRRVQHNTEEGGPSKKLSRQS